jgi:hypothetical protein
VESLEKPVSDRVLQAMAQAYPDPVDLGLLSMVLGCEQRLLQAAAGELVGCGLAQARIVSDNGSERWEAPCITDKGMAVADGFAANAEEASALLDRLEAAALRQLLAQRIRASRLPEQQANELQGSLAQVDDRSLVDAAQVWAHQNVSDWRALVRGMHGGANSMAPGASASG